MVLQEWIQALLQESVKRKDASVDKVGVGGCLWYHKHSFWNLPNRKGIYIITAYNALSVGLIQSTEMLWRKRNKIEENNSDCIPFND